MRTYIFFNEREGEIVIFLMTFLKKPNPVCAIPTKL